MLRILIGVSLIASVSNAANLDGSWKVVGYRCKSGMFKPSERLNRPRYARFTFDTESMKAVMSFEGGGCLFVGELNLKISGDELTFSDYRSTSDCGEIESFSSFKSSYRWAPGILEKLLMIDQKDELCLDESASEMELQRINGS